MHDVPINTTFTRSGAQCRLTWVHPVMQPVVFNLSEVQEQNAKEGNEHRLMMP